MRPIWRSFAIRLIVQMQLYKNRQTFGWSTGVNYNAGDLVYYRDVLYVCIRNHLSSLEDRPTVATGLWQLYT